MLKTAAELRAEHPEAARALEAEVSISAGLAERTRIAGIMKLNTAANRAVAAEKIDAAVADGTATAGDLAQSILEAQKVRTARVKTSREEDAEDLEDLEPELPADAAAEAEASRKAGNVKIDYNGAYAAVDGKRKGAN